MRYSERAQSAINYAEQEAARLNHDYISTGHLFLGLIRDGEGTAIEFLREMNVDLEKVKAELESLMAGRSRASVVGQSNLTGKVNDAIRMAAEESEGMGHKYVGTEHLLIGLIREREGVASKILAKYGIDLEKARAAARSIEVEEDKPFETLTFRGADVTMPAGDAEAARWSSISEKEILDLDEASRFLGTTAENLKKLLETEDVPARMIGDQWRFSRSALVRWLGEGKSRNYTKS